MARNYPEIITSILALVESDPEAAAFCVDLRTMLHNAQDWEGPI